MNYDESSVQMCAFRLSVKMVDAFEETFDLSDKNHMLPTVRALCLQSINAYLLEDRPIALDVKNEVLEFYIEDFNKRTEGGVLELPVVDTNEDPSHLDLADMFSKMVLENLNENVYKKHIKSCLSELRKEEPDTYAALVHYFFLYTPENLEEEYPVALLEDYSLPNDIDLDDVERVFREGAYAVLPRFACNWDHEHHPLNIIKSYVDEILDNSRNIFLNLEEWMKTSVRSGMKR